MFRIYSKIRKSLFLEGKFKNYLFYAIGEILLVIIGIFIALQANTWAESRKLQSTEERILRDLRSEIKTNISILDSVTQKRIDVLNAGKLILEHSGPEGKWNSNLNFDSLIFKIILSGWKFFPETGVVTDILNSGKLNVIRNDSIRYMISSLPAQVALLNDEDDTYRLDLHGYFVPFFSGNYAIRNTVLNQGLFNQNMDLGESLFVSEVESLLRNQELEGVLTTQGIWTNTSIGLYNRQREIYLLMLELISNQLKT